MAKGMGGMGDLGQVMKQAQQMMRQREKILSDLKERVVEASLHGAKGHAFTDSPREFRGTLREVLNLELTTSQNRAIYVATLNAVFGGLKMVEKTVHCRDEEPEECASEIAELLLKKYGQARVGLIGLNPAIAEHFARAFGAESLCITDLNQDNIGASKFGVEIWDGKTRTEELIERSDLVVLTGSTLVNGTFDRIFNSIQQGKKTYVVYGVTAAGAAELTGFNRYCPYGR